MDLPAAQILHMPTWDQSGHRGPRRRRTKGCARRFVVCLNLERADRDAAVRTNLVATLRG